MSEYKSEFEAPPYSVLSKVGEGTSIVTTVILDGELQQFVAPMSLRAAGMLLTIPPEDEELIMPDWDDL